LGLEKYFEILVSKEDVPHPKPAPDTFLRCAEIMQAEPADCQVFEDGDPGLRAARTAGMIATDIRPYVNGKQ
jgi:HAD superfamily hydrolase (TIGR01509 family)